MRSLSITGTNARRFNLSRDGCTLAQLAAGQPCTVHVALRPLAVGPVTAQLDISSTDPLSPVRSLQITGQGIPSKMVYLPLVMRSR